MPSDNIFALTSITKLLYLVICSDNYVILKTLLKQNKLITRLITSASSEKKNDCTGKAMSFLVLNIIRLQSSIQSMDHYLPCFVNTQPSWINFLGKIKDWASAQISPGYIGFYSPLTKWLRETVSAKKYSYPDLNTANLSVDINIGSIYAYHLGFVPPKAEIKKAFFELKAINAQNMEDLPEYLKGRHRRSKSLQKNSLTCNWRYPDKSARDDLLMNLRISNNDDDAESVEWNEPYE